MATQIRMKGKPTIRAQIIQIAIVKHEVDSGRDFRSFSYDFHFSLAEAGSKYDRECIFHGKRNSFYFH